MTQKNQFEVNPAGFVKNVATTGARVLGGLALGGVRGAAKAFNEAPAVKSFNRSQHFSPETKTAIKAGTAVALGSAAMPFAPGLVTAGMATTGLASAVNTTNKKPKQAINPAQRAGHGTLSSAQRTATYRPSIPGSYKG